MLTKKQAEQPLNYILRYEQFGMSPVQMFLICFKNIVVTIDIYVNNLMIVN